MLQCWYYWWEGFKKYAIKMKISTAVQAKWWFRLKKIWESEMLVLLIWGINEIRREDRFRLHVVPTGFHEDWWRHSTNIKALPQQFERLQCWCYWWKGFMKYPVEMILGVMIYIRSFIMIGSCVRKLLCGDLLGTHIQTAKWSNKPTSIFSGRQK
jgi:hypothetical protein